MSHQCNLSIFSVDVEDWFHILDVPAAPPLSKWSVMPSNVERNFGRLLELFEESNTHVTCFFLGWIAQRFPHLVREASAAGHEIASHGYAHRLAYEMTRSEFQEDVYRARVLLENLVGVPVLGYRTAGFAATDQTPWFFDELIAAGYRYDSSIFPARRGHGGDPTANCTPHLVERSQGTIIEVPITVAKLGMLQWCFFGGGYLRIFPYALVRCMAQRVAHDGRPVVFYVHPREIEPDQPRLPMSLRRRFKTYVNLRTTKPKISRILQDFSVTTFHDYLSQTEFAPVLTTARSAIA